MSILSDLAARLLRSDNWQNALTGWGTSRDKTTLGSFGSDYQIPDSELQALYHHNDIARKIVALIPREMLRQGFKVVADTPENSTLLENDARKLNVRRQFREGMIWGRLYGGAVMFVGANDGQTADQPLQVDAIRSVNFLEIYDRRYAVVESRYEDSTHPKFQKPKTYRLQRVRGSGSTVHESRLVKFHGAHTDETLREQLGGWDFSVLQSVYEAMRRFDAYDKAGELLMSDASQGVFKLKGLISAIAMGKTNDLVTRSQLLDQTRNIMRAIMLDADNGEEFTKVATSFAGVPDMLDRAAKRLSAATEIPVTVLMGESPAGLNATGDNDVRRFYDSIKTEQEQDLGPLLERVIGYMASARKIQGAIKVKFPSLWQETPKEKSDRKKMEADTDAIYIQNEVITPEEVAEIRCTGDDSTYHLNLAGRPPVPPRPKPLAPPPAAGPKLAPTPSPAPKP